ncbi:MAG: hypothetical protein ACK559_39440, partial [bacterium]
MQRRGGDLGPGALRDPEPRDLEDQHRRGDPGGPLGPPRGEHREAEGGQQGPAVGEAHQAEAGQVDQRAGRHPLEDPRPAGVQHGPNGEEQGARDEAQPGGGLSPVGPEQPERADGRQREVQVPEGVHVRRAGPRSPPPRGDVRRHPGKRAGVFVQVSPCLLYTS